MEFTCNCHQDQSIVVCVDLDDTLIHTSSDYTKAISECAEKLYEWYPSEFEDEDEAVQFIRDIDYELIEKYGVSPERFVEGFRESLIRASEGDFTDEQMEIVEELGGYPHKSEEEYQERGFINGARDMLHALSSVGEELHLVSSGIESLQHRKVRALGLDEWFDDFHILPEADKSSVFQRLNDDGRVVVHIGNSVTSDIESAINAGVHSVYVSDELDWLSDNHNSLEHQLVRGAFESAPEFVDEADDVLCWCEVESGSD